LAIQYRTLDEGQIREAENRDISLLADIIRRAYRDVAVRFGLTSENCQKHPSNCDEGWIEKDLERGVVYYILECGTTPIGCVALEKTGSAVCYLERLAVLPAYRRNGFGRMLVEHIYDRAKTLKFATISIGIISEQTELKSWYRNAGFIEGETKEFSHLPFLVTFMTRALSLHSNSA
jgi:N-acetylglutamate synthase-like GNAT family acetyltransferase